MQANEIEDLSILRLIVCLCYNLHNDQLLLMKGKLNFEVLEITRD